MARAAEAAAGGAGMRVHCADAAQRVRGRWRAHPRWMNAAATRERMAGKPRRQKPAGWGGGEGSAGDGNTGRSTRGQAATTGRRCLPAAQEPALAAPHASPPPAPPPAPTKVSLGQMAMSPSLLLDRALQRGLHRACMQQHAGKPSTAICRPPPRSLPRTGQRRSSAAAVRTCGGGPVLGRSPAASPWTAWLRRATPGMWWVRGGAGNPRART